MITKDDIVPGTIFRLKTGEEWILVEWLPANVEYPPKESLYFIMNKNRAFKIGTNEYWEAIPIERLIQNLNATGAKKVGEASCCPTYV